MDELQIIIWESLSDKGGKTVINRKAAEVLLNWIQRWKILKKISLSEQNMAQR